MNEPATTILVIDDEQPFCEVVAEILTTFGYPVRKAFNAAQALEVLEIHVYPKYPSLCQVLSSSRKTARKR